MNARDRLIVALDFPSRQKALAMVDLLGEAVLWYKVGLELYLAEGAQIVHELKDCGKEVFLDLKLHDIPNTVAGAVHSVAQTQASLLTVHAAGGPAMVRAAVEAALSSGRPMTILAVTVLTSMDETQLAATGVARSPQEQVAVLGRMALAAGAHGLVCSPNEVAALRSLAGPVAELVVPGIRSNTTGSAKDDQKRTASAGQALRSGASRIVVGRPITQANDPAGATQLLLQEVEAAI